MNIKRLKIFTGMVGLSMVLLAGCKSKSTITSGVLQINTKDLECALLSTELEQITLELEEEKEENAKLNERLEYLLAEKKEEKSKEDDIHFMYQNTAGIFRFSYLKEQLSNNGQLVFDEIGSEFRVISQGENKLLLDANYVNKVYLSGFEELGHPFYFKGYDPNYGGKDCLDHYCGWVLPVYYSDGTFSLYDFDDFSLLLANCDVSEDFACYGDVCGSNPLECFYLEAYDPIYGGHDRQDNGSGLVCQISKNGIYYLVDANDFAILLDAGFTNHVCDYEDCDGTIRAVFSYGDLENVDCYSRDAIPYETVDRASYDIIPYRSDILMKKF